MAPHLDPAAQTMAELISFLDPLLDFGEGAFECIEEQIDKMLRRGVITSGTARLLQTHFECADSDHSSNGERQMTIHSGGNG